MFVNQHESTRIAQPFHRSNGIDTFEGGQHHAELERQFVFLFHLTGVVQFGDEHLSRFNFGHARVGDPFDVVVAEVTLQH